MCAKFREQRRKGWWGHRRKLGALGTAPRASPFLPHAEEDVGTSRGRLDGHAEIQHSSSCSRLAPCPQSRPQLPALGGKSLGLDRICPRRCASLFYTIDRGKWGGEMDKDGVEDGGTWEGRVGRAIWLDPKDIRAPEPGCQSSGGACGHFILKAAC